MPSPLQKSPLGLLGLFGLKTLGKNPDAFADAVAPTFDVGDFYGVDQLQYVGLQSAAVQNVGDTVTLTVPINTVWRVHAAAATIITGAPVTSDDGVGCVVQVGQSTTFVTLAYQGSDGFIPVNSAAAIAAVYAPSRPLVLPPGTLLAAGNVREYSAPVTMLIRALVEALPV